MVLDYFEDPWSFPSPRFRAWVLATKLRNAESGSNFIDHRLRESQQVILAGSGPEQWLLAGDALRSRHVIIPVLGYRVKRAPSFVRIPHCHGQAPHQFRNARKMGIYQGIRSGPFISASLAEQCPALPLAKFHQTGEQPLETRLLCD